MRAQGRADRNERMRRVRAWLARGAAAALAVVMLFGVLRSGSSYFYCPAMKLVADAPCCDADRADHDDDDAITEVRSRDCCEQHFLARLPATDRGATARTPSTLPPPLVATLPPSPTVASTRLASLEPRTFAESRAGPIALARHRAELMVALN